jgi:hypothetical protein
MNTIKAAFYRMDKIIMAIVPWYISLIIIQTAFGQRKMDWIDAGLILSYMFIARRRDPNF